MTARTVPTFARGAAGNLLYTTPGGRPLHCTGPLNVGAVVGYSGPIVPDRLPMAVEEQTEVGSYFVATYPPFSVWSQEAVAREARPALQAPPQAGVPLGMYLHIPFCRKRCHFCYFRVYTDKNAQEVRSYLDVLAHEWEMWRRQPAVAGRPLNFVYFGGGTPSFLSTSQLSDLVSRLTAATPWRDAEEVTFECEPGTLTETKLSVIRDIGVTRLSLGVENFSDEVLTLNGRAHRSPEIFRAYEFARSIDFPQINIDLIAGMLGETEANWQDCIRRTLDLAPDSVTIYQMELPFNTTISGDRLKGTGRFQEPVADWRTKRRWVREAFEAFEAAGYHVGSAYTVVKDRARTRFVYRDRLWQGADMVGLGVASFGHVNGVHVQNLDTWETYSDAIRQDDLALSRAYRPTPEERMIREFILQLKLGSLSPEYFERKYGVRVLERFREPLGSLRDEGYLARADDETVSLTREGLLRVDLLLTRFFLPEHAGIRYT
jgi:oxygen-independent coproporphyrinogen III oxidase